MTSHPCAARPSKGSKSKNMALNKDSTIAAMTKSKVTIREYDRDCDMEAVEKLERSCEIGAGRGFSIVTNMMGDPLCRIRLFPLHIMLVAEVIGGGGEVVGVARGCVKRVATGLAEGSTVLAGYILGLRVSPLHRRKGIGLKLIKSVEAWAARHGARHVVAAAEATNVASRSLFVGKCGYAPTAHLSILIQPLAGVRPASGSKRSDVKIERLSVEQAALLYKRRFGGQPLCPSDVDAVLSAPPSLGTWAARFVGGASAGAGAWACMSLWNTCASYKLQVVAQRTEGGRALLARLAAVAPMPCMGAATRRAPCGEFGFVLAYGIDGEGDGAALQALVRALWLHAAGAARRVGAECKALVTEATAGDPVVRHVPRGRRASRVDDVWLVKAVTGGGAAALLARTSRRRFVDPRDF